jgi:MYXO-CTERM domain-containing protein
MIFLLAAALVVAGYAATIGASAASAQESSPVPTLAPREGPSEGEAVAPASDEDATEQVIIAPAPDEVAPEEEQPAEGTPEDASEAEDLIAPASDDTSEEELIAPAPKGESGDDGSSGWVYWLLAGAGLAAVAGALAWRLRRHNA